MRRKIIVTMLLLCCYLDVFSQYISNINPANSDDPRVLVANPAGIGYNGAAIVAGYQNLYAGLSGSLSKSLVGFVYPTPRFGSFAVSGQTFQTPLLSRSAIDLRYAYHFDSFRTAIGVNIGSLLTSYDRSGFQLVDAGDPLLDGHLSLNTLNLGLGVFSNVYDELFIALSVDHLNKPTVSLQGDYKKDMHLRAGALYTWNDFRPQVVWEFDENEHYFSAGAEYWFEQLGHADMTAMVRGFWSVEHMTLGAGLLFKNIRLDYLLDYPLTDLSAFAGGTHQFIASYALAEMAECAEPLSFCVVTKKVFQAHAKFKSPATPQRGGDLATGDTDADGSRFSPVAVDSVCTFDLSHSSSPCGWKNWLLGVYYINDNGEEKVVWHASGKGKPADRIRWLWPRSLFRESDYNRTFYCKLRIVDKKGHVAISQPDQFYIEYNPTTESQ